MYNKKRMRPNIEPCGTPHLTFIHEDEQLFIDGAQINSFETSFVLFFGYHTCKVYSIGLYVQLCQMPLKYPEKYCKVFSYFLRN